MLHLIDNFMVKELFASKIVAKEANIFVQNHSIDSQYTG